MISTAISAHGTRVLRNGVAIDEMKDVTPPPLSRTFTDKSLRGSDDEEVNKSKRHVGPLAFALNYLTSNATILGLLVACDAGTLDAYEVHYPDGGIWTFAGFVESVAPKTPVDGVLDAQIVIQPSGGITLPVSDVLLLLENGDTLALETGDSILVEAA